MNFTNFNFQFQYTLALENIQLLLHKSSEHQTEDPLQCSFVSHELDITAVVNLPASGKLHQSTTVSSQCERLSYPCTWSTMDFDW